VVEGAALEMLSRGNFSQGSNPCLSVETHTDQAFQQFSTAESDRAGIMNWDNKWDNSVFCYPTSLESRNSYSHFFCELK
jgi:hypothetical protein